MISENTLEELEVLLNCSGASAAECANCICGGQDFDNYQFYCRYKEILDKIKVKLSETHEGEKENDES